MNVNDLFQRLTILAQFCNQSISKEMLNFYDSVLSVYGYDKAVGAIDKIITMRRGRDFFPSPADIAKVIQPQLDPDDEAREAASRIIGAISKYGQYNPGAAKEYIGELGWAVVNRFGGWMNICIMDIEESTTTMQAQFRDLAKSIYRRAELGIYTAPKLPSNQGMIAISEIVKSSIKEIPK